jgi:hypothetical protein
MVCDWYLEAEGVRKRIEKVRRSSCTAVTCGDEIVEGKMWE